MKDPRESSFYMASVAKAMRKGMRQGEIETQTNIRKEERLENDKRSRAGQVGKVNQNIMPKEKIANHLKRQTKAKDMKLRKEVLSRKPLMSNDEFWSRNEHDFNRAHRLNPKL